MVYKVTGCINFPIDDTRYSNTGASGTIVKLVVHDDREKDTFAVCSGSIVFDVMISLFVGDDKHLIQRGRLNGESEKHFQQVVQYHFPKSYNDDSSKRIEKYLSRPYLASIIMGSTDWYGWDESEKRYWKCTYDDLTEDGKALYHQIQNLYKGCNLSLITFLDP